MAVGITVKTLPVVTVTTAATAVKFNASHLEAQSMLICADPSNTNNIYIGDSTVTAATGIPLAPGEKMGIDGLRRRGAGDDSFYLDTMWVCADTNGNKLRILNTIAI